MSYQNRFYVSVLVHTDDNQVLIFRQETPTPNGDPKDFCWIPVYRKLPLDTSPRSGAIHALEECTGLKVNGGKFELLTVQSKPIEEYKCWMFTVFIPKKDLLKIKSEHSSFIVPINEVPHPQNWILSAYLEYP